MTYWHFQILHYDVFDLLTIEPSSHHAPIFNQDCVVAKVVLRQSNKMEASCCHVATSDRGCAGAEAVPNRKPRSEWRGWETSFKPTLLLRAEGAIRAFFDGYCRGDIASGVRNVAITRRHQMQLSLPLWLRLFPLTYRAWELRGVRRSRWDNTLPVKHDFFHHILYNFFIFSTYTLFAILYSALHCVYN